MNNRNKWLAGTVLVATLSGGMLWEGKRNVPYIPIPGDVKTVCYGETKVEMRRYTDAECVAMLKQSMVKYADGVLQCIDVPINQNEHSAFTLFAYNAGTSAFCRSSMAKKLNAGDHAGACGGLLAWSYSGGRYVQGLRNRRLYERDLCVKPVPAPSPDASKEVA